MGDTEAREVLGAAYIKRKKQLSTQEGTSMTTYDNTNRGVLFDNDRKETDNHPDMNGTLNINGVEHWFSGWWKNGSQGRVPVPEHRQAEGPAATAPAARATATAAAPWQSPEQPAAAWLRRAVSGPCSPGLR
jgi:hypothetical protein